MEIYLSCDIEADGPIPGPYSMSSFAFVAVALRTNDGDLIDLDIDDPENQFYAELKPISDQFVPEAAAVSGLNRQHLIENGSTPADAMAATAEWIKTLSAKHGNARPVFVAYPLSFDWMWYYWYTMNFFGSSPFGHSSAVDIKSYYMARADTELRKVGKRSIPGFLKSKRRHTHHALDDAAEQGELARNIFRWRRPDQNS